ncbi:MAG: hypothetical protein IT379_01935 [Deltaproteobacteria bacterium]|nr:hypothetical protein [Deltaproteobacteria bacterium]
MRDPVLFVALVALAAAWATTHVATLVSVLRSRVSVVLRIVAFVPPATPIVAILAGATWRAVAWIVLALAYGGVRFFA